MPTLLKHAYLSCLDIQSNPIEVDNYFISVIWNLVHNGVDWNLLVNFDTIGVLTLWSDEVGITCKYFDAQVSSY